MKGCDEEGRQQAIGGTALPPRLASSSSVAASIYRSAIIARWSGGYPSAWLLIRLIAIPPEIKAAHRLTCAPMINAPERDDQSDGGKLPSQDSLHAWCQRLREGASERSGGMSRC
jgi:hypothetical protein